MRMQYAGIVATALLSAGLVFTSPAHAACKPPSSVDDTPGVGAPARDCDKEKTTGLIGVFFELFGFE